MKCDECGRELGDPYIAVIEGEGDIAVWHFIGDGATSDVKSLVVAYRLCLRCATKLQNSSEYMEWAHPYGM
jgi:hypothetical protein